MQTILHECWCREVPINHGIFQSHEFLLGDDALLVQCFGCGQIKVIEMKSHAHI